MCHCWLYSVLNEERRKSEEKRKAAEGEAYQRSRKILEEEISKDRTWRQAVQQVASRTYIRERLHPYWCW